LGKPQAMILSPEVPYPPVGGGALRSASIVEYLAARYDLGAIHFRQVGDPDPALDYPAGHLAEAHLIPLPFHARTLGARIGRNVWRAARGVPPMQDRFSGLENEIRSALRERRFAVIVVEHLWLAQYAGLLRDHAEKLVLDLHNIESRFFDTMAATSPLWYRPFLERFARANGELERALLPRFDLVLTTSPEDSTRVEGWAPGKTHVVPNTIPPQPQPSVEKRNEIVFTGNFEYQPNQLALAWFTAQCWPELLKRSPELKLRLVGKQIEYAIPNVRHDVNVEFVGPVEDAVKEIAHAKAAIVPLLSGSGTRLKIIEAWAAGTAVVSTPLGAEGLDAVPDEHLKLAASAWEFTQTTARLLDNEKERFRLARNARALYEERYTWRRVTQILSQLDL
jgi:polysaccharide biosynthesis protein PslH